MAAIKTPYEIRVIDLLMCAPSLNFQLALKRLVDGEAAYDVYSFFKTSNLKPTCQVPNVFNSQLTVDQKKATLLAYLRQTVQRENLSLFGEHVNRIYDLELALVAVFHHERSRTSLIERLNECYQKVQKSPYCDVSRQYRFKMAEKVYEESYVRACHQNLSLTGLYCVVVAPRQEIWNLPLAVPYLRGSQQTYETHFNCVEMEETVDLSNLFPLLVKTVNNQERSLMSSNSKPKLQLVIHYRESFVSAPSETVVSIGYDESDSCCLTFHNLHGELLHPPTARGAPQPPLTDLEVLPDV